MQDGNQSAQPQSNVPEGQAAPEAVTDAEKYWKSVAERTREKASKFEDYEILINHLNTNPSLVNDFERLVLGQAKLIEVSDEMHRTASNNSSAETAEDRLARELGLDNGNEQRQAQPQGTPGQRPISLDEAKRIGAAEERARRELTEFKDDMVQHGIGEHMVDEFLEYLRNPTGLTYHDLFSAWRSQKIRTTKVDPLGQVQVPSPKPNPNPGVMPTTVSGLPGSQANRPNVPRQDGRPGFVSKHVQDPANI